MTNKHPVEVGRVDDPRTPEDAIRVAVDRVWPRGLSNDKANLDEWCKHIAPSVELRTWYGHDPGRFSIRDRPTRPFPRRRRADQAMGASANSGGRQGAPDSAQHAMAVAS
jgi:hypothetical protein